MTNGGVARIGWAKDAAEIVELGAFFAKSVVTLPAYISHGEIQCELSRDGSRWSAEAEKLIASFFDHLSQGGPSERVAGAWDRRRRPLAVAIVEIEERTTFKYAVLADILVEASVRGKGIGERLIHFIEQELRAEGANWLFLESGIKNKAAHKFFKRLEYRETSRVFAKQL